MLLPVHILAGALGLVFGTVALASAKGGKVHRRSGLFFVYAMLAMAVTGAVIAALHGGEASVIAGLLASYLAMTAFTTVRPSAAGSRRLNVGAMTVALAIGLSSLALGLEALGNGGQREGIPAVVLFKFAAVALLASAGDLRVIRSGPLRGAPRLARHLWRMCFALYIGTASFFLGQADEFPEPLRVPALLAIPAFLPLLLMAFWLWRVRSKRAYGVT
jgi:uncharacterized membrane protein